MSTLTRSYYSLHAGALEVLRGRRGEASVAGLFWFSVVMVGGLLLTDLREYLPAEGLAVSQQASVLAIAMIIMTALLTEAVEPFLGIPAVRQTAPIRRLVGVSAWSMLMPRIIGWVGLIAAPASALVIGSLGWHIGTSAVATVLAVIVSWVTLALLATRRWVRAARKDWRMISIEPSGADVISEGVDGYGIALLSGAMTGLVIWLVDGGSLNRIIGVAMAVLAVVSAAVLVTRLAWKEMHNA